MSGKFDSFSISFWSLLFEIQLNFHNNLTKLSYFFSKKMFSGFYMKGSVYYLYFTKTNFGAIFTLYFYTEEVLKLLTKFLHSYFYIL